MFLNFKFFFATKSLRHEENEILRSGLRVFKSRRGLHEWPLLAAMRILALMIRRGPIYHSCLAVETSLGPKENTDRNTNISNSIIYGLPKILEL